nr:16S rRNA (cytosine(1402)-N(4))-methyltransferase RsmH [Desulfobacterales bacterium]
MKDFHIPVMVGEVVHFLGCAPGKTFVDCTIGGGGHARAILEASHPDGCMIGIDRDPKAVLEARRALRQYGPRIRIFHEDFVNLRKILLQEGKTRVHGILLDLGMSLYQLQESGRGFSFKYDEPLDMRMNPNSGITAEELVNKTPEKGLSVIIKRYGEERWSRRIAKRIVESRAREPIRSSRRLAEIVCAAVPRGSCSQRIHPATRTFQAIRIAVNQELKQLEIFLDDVADHLLPKGRICIISFHSLEDRIVKQRFRALEKGCKCPPHLPYCTCNKEPKIRIITRKPIRPAPEEISKNPMARSARLRVAERL